MPEFLVEDQIELVSQVLGCNIVVETPTNNRSLFLSESILAALEAFFATSLDSEIFPHQANIRFQMIPASPVADIIDFQIQAENTTNLGTLITVQHSINDSYIEDSNSEKLNRKLTELVIHLVHHIAFVPDLEQYFDKLAKEESAFSRALNFTNIAPAIWNILGEMPKVRLPDWQLNNTENHFPSRRIVVWNNESTQPNTVKTTTQVNSLKSSPEPGEIPSEVKHRDRKIYSLLDVTLWNKASWRATGVVFDSPTPQTPPLLALPLLFHNRDACKEIFTQWKNEIGDTDKEERIRISIITGIDSDNPAAYRVVIGVNPDWIKASDSSHFIMTHRINTMQPKDPTHLNQFIDFFDELGFYILMPGYISQDFASVDLFWELGILKQQVYIRPAWQIGEHDFDLSGITPEDKIIIPKEVENPPIIRALAKIRKMRSR